MIPLVAEMASDLAELAMLHSDFRPLMLESPEQPLPKAAAELAAPLTSLLPIVSVQDTGKRVRTKEILPVMWHFDSGFAKSGKTPAAGPESPDKGKVCWLYRLWY